ncbi:MAG: SRPBCC family protein [Planctomycetota bacterium]|nr:SRPBCC family protein [Planctomycetota bacterium]
MADANVRGDAAPKKRAKWPIVLGALAALIVIFLIVVALQPSDFRVTRSSTISAPPETVYGQVNDFRKWSAWSPWEKLDPAMKRTFEGPAEGVGAVYAWAGNDQVGEGRMTIAESKPGELVRIKLDFLKPFESTSTSEFVFAGEGGGTKVTWSMYGKNDFVGKAFCIFMNMDKMIGADFEKGLAQMKSAAEAAAKP